MTSLNDILFRSILPHPGMPNLSPVTLYPTLIDIHSDGEVYLAKGYISEQRILHLLALLIFNVMGFESGFFGFKVRLPTTRATTTTDVIGIFFRHKSFFSFCPDFNESGKCPVVPNSGRNSSAGGWGSRKNVTLEKSQKKEILRRLIAATFIFFLFLSFWGDLNGVNAQTRIE